MLSEFCGEDNQHWSSGKMPGRVILQSQETKAPDIRRTWLIWRNVGLSVIWSRSASCLGFWEHKECGFGCGLNITFLVRERM